VYAERAAPGKSSSSSSRYGWWPAADLYASAAAASASSSKRRSRRRRRKAVPARKSAMSAIMPTAENVPATAAVLCRKLWRRGN
jgi:hypothetical protein